MSGLYSSKSSGLGFKSQVSRLGSTTSVEKASDSEVLWYGIRDWFVLQTRSSGDESDCDEIGVVVCVVEVARGREVESTLAWRSRCPVSLLSSMPKLYSEGHLYV